MDEVSGARVDPWTLVKNTIYGGPAYSGSLCDFIDGRSRFGPHYLQNDNEGRSRFAS